MRFNSKRYTRARIANQLASLLLALNCVGHMHRTYRQQRTSDYVYAKTIDGTLDDAQRALQAQGFQVTRMRDYLATQWRQSGSARSRLLVRAIAVDEAHSHLQVYELSPKGIDRRSQLPTRDVDPVEYINRRNDVSSLDVDPSEWAQQQIEGKQSQSNVQMGSDNPAGSRVLRRAWEEEWKLLQVLDAKAAREIDTEESVVSGCALTRAFRSHPKPPVFPKLPNGFCLADVQGASQLFETHRLIVLGEQHGTREAPLFAESLACQAAAAGHKVSVGVELLRTDQSSLDRYLASEGTPDDKRQLVLSSRSWVHTWYDGRSSEAVFALVERVRLMRRAEMPITLFAYDEPDQAGAERDASMARTVETMRRPRLDEVIIVLTGNVHARTVQGVPWDSTFLPMGFYLERFGLRPVTLDMSYVSGTAWNCTGEKKLDCGVHPMRSTKSTHRLWWQGAGGPTDKNKITGPLMPVSTREFYVTTWNSPSPEGYWGEFYVGTITASSPTYKPGS